MLVHVGFKEIDISFPSASQTEFDFTRKLVTTSNAVPEDVWLQVLSPCRKELIRRTVDSVTGARKAILSLYIATSKAFRDAIFGMSQDEILKKIIDCVTYAKSITKDDPNQNGTTWNLMFSPEAFSDTDIDYSIRVCEAVREIWQPTEDNPIILNLPGTVEVSTPNHYADQVELFCNGITQKEKVCVSLHPHNDRGCAVAAAELGQMAGATRVEGCLFGNGERTGNVDLITLVLNLYSQGIDPRINFSNLPAVKSVVEDCTRIPVHTRAPYGGEAVFQAFSGSHQDAINKAFHRMRDEGTKSWRVPYLPIDPHDLGLSYESVIRLNSQSGKGGVSWTLERMMDLELPKGLQISFSKEVKSLSESQARTIPSEEVMSLFLEKYQVLGENPQIRSANYRRSVHSSQKMHDAIVVHAILLINGESWPLRARGEDMVSAVNNAFSALRGLQLSFESHMRHITFEDGKIHRVAIVECRINGTDLSAWGVSVSENFDETELKACLSSAIVRLHLEFDGRS